MCFDRGKWEKVSHGVRQETVQRLKLTSAQLAEVNARHWEAGQTGQVGRQRVLLDEARLHLTTLKEQLRQASVESRCPNTLPTPRTREEELLAWATGFAWHPES